MTILLRGPSAIVDLPCEVADGTLRHLELQSGNDAEMPLRMAGYAPGAYRRLQSYELRDLRDLDGEDLLTSDQVGDNVLAVLARLSVMLRSASYPFWRG